MYTQSHIDVDVHIAECIEELYRTTKINRSNFDCVWHGPRLKNNPYEWFQPTYQRIQQVLGQLQIDQWWFNCGEPGEGYRWHAHVPYKWAAVLYIKVPPNSGGIEFKKMGEITHFNPKEGDFIIFPGHQAHRVTPNYSDANRISVAFNIK